MKKLEKFIKEYWLVAIMLLLIAFICCSCGSSKQLPVSHDTIYKTNIEYINKYMHDSIYLHDSVWMTLKGDTIWVDRWHTKYIERTAHDTIATTDTIYQTKEVPVEVIKKRTPFGVWVLLLFLTSVCGGLIAYLIKKME